MAMNAPADDMSSLEDIFIFLSMTITPPQKRVRFKLMAQKERYFYA
jgi:hypothetical protein